MKNSKLWMILGVALLVLLIDQYLKIWIKTHLVLGDSIPVLGNWFLLHFTENPGMAFGMKFGGEAGKIILTVFRIILVVVIGIYISRLFKKQAPTGMLVGVTLILAGAVGNIIDSLFYGMIFTDSYGHVATMFPTEGGYAPFLQGRVVDMFYFPIIETTFPQWFPIWGGEEFIFFRPIFNMADSAITIGVLYLLLFQYNYLLHADRYRKSTDCSST
jgi:signal peptidase II